MSYIFKIEILRLVRIYKMEHVMRSILAKMNKKISLDRV